MTGHISKLWLLADAQYKNNNMKSWSRYCLLSPCIATNISNFNITIPTSAVPDGYPYSLDYSLFRPNSNGSTSFYGPIWHTFEATTFNITGSTTAWTDYDKTGRFSQDNYFRPWFPNLTCDALECARKCAAGILPPLVPYVNVPFPELDGCVATCFGMGAKPTRCFMQNAGPVSSPNETSSTASTSKGTSSPKTDIPKSSAAVARFTAGQVPCGLLVLAWFFWF